MVSMLQIRWTASCNTERAAAFGGVWCGWIVVKSAAVNMTARAKNMRRQAQRGEGVSRQFCSRLFCIAMGQVRGIIPQQCHSFFNTQATTNLASWNLLCRAISRTRRRRLLSFTLAHGIVGCLPKVCTSIN